MYFEHPSLPFRLLFLATFFGAFFPTALRPADDLVFFADFFDDFLAVAPLQATGNLLRNDRCPGL